MLPISVLISVQAVTPQKLSLTTGPSHHRFVVLGEHYQPIQEAVVLRLYWIVEENISVILEIVSD